jgi:hypothetical protein
MKVLVDATIEGRRADASMQESAPNFDEAVERVFGCSNVGRRD